LIAVAAWTPALSARQPDGGDALNKASDNTLRNVFSTQTNKTVDMFAQPNRRRTK